MSPLLRPSIPFGVCATIPAFKEICATVVAGVLATMTCSCSLAPAIETNSLDYNSTIENVSNTSLVLNVLRARDEAPLYFPDLSQVRGSVTLSAAAQATFPFGPRFSSTNRRSLQDGPITATTNPSFDIAPTNTKDFYQGILNPLSKDLLYYYVERYIGSGVSRYVFFLLVGGIEESTDDGIRRNFTWRDPEYETIFNKWFVDAGGKHGPRVVALNRAVTLLGPPVKADADSIIKADAAGLKIGTVANGKIQLSKQSSGAVLCMPNGTGYEAVSVAKNSVVKPVTGEQNAEPIDSEQQTFACNSLSRAGHSQNRIKYTLRMRSVEDIFFFLGTLIDPRSNFGRRATGECLNKPYIPFYISELTGSHIRFSTHYRGVTYYVSDTDNKDECGRYDNTLVILGILNELLNLNRDAKDVPTTKATQIVNQ